MQIGSAIPFIPPQPASAPARPLTPEVSPDLIRADLPPATPTQSSSSSEQRDLRDENGRPDGLAREDQAGQVAAREEAALRAQQVELAELASRDREVRAHEQAHAAVGGVHAGAPSYTYDRGPDGKSYAVGGEVGIDVSPVSGDPEATLRKMDIVQRAALAPAEPSAQDRSVAAQAQSRAAMARVELGQMQREEAAQEAQERNLRHREQAQEGATSAPPEASASSILEAYRNLSALHEPEARVDLRA